MMAADYRHIDGLENRLGRHYSRFFAFWPARPLPINHLPCENCAMLGRIGEVGLAETAVPEAAPRLAAVARLEAEVIRHLGPSMCRPADLASAALQRTSYARTLFGRIAVHGRTEMSPVWRPLLAALAAETDVRWIAGPRHVPSWVHELGIPVV